ncbi:MAG: hypothetical protein FJ096_22050, partial [Deltaproteobacteria bacterium]|nr:hypothetical protein [Deltaproteobacteria bacterium]
MMMRHKIDLNHGASPVRRDAVSASARTLRNALGVGVLAAVGAVSTACGDASEASATATGSSAAAGGGSASTAGGGGGDGDEKPPATGTISLEACIGETGVNERCTLVTEASACTNA